MSDNFYLYRIFNRRQKLLYVGRTAQPGMRRIKQHQASKDWWPEARSIKTTRYKSLDSLRRAEARAIRKEKPRYNKAVPKAPRRSLFGWRKAAS